MKHFCQACGFKNVYSGVKPKTCQNCSGSLEPKPVAVQPASRYEEPEEVSTLDINEDAVRRSIRLEDDGGNSLMTIESIAKRESFGPRGQPPLDADKRNEVLKGLLGGTSAEPTFTPPQDQRGGAKRVGRLTR